MSQAKEQPSEEPCRQPEGQIAHLSVDVGESNTAAPIQAPDNEQQNEDVPVQTDSVEEPTAKRARMEPAVTLVTSTPAMPLATSNEPNIAQNQPNIAQVSPPSSSSSSSPTEIQQESGHSTDPLPLPDANAPPTSSAQLPNTDGTASTMTDHSSQPPLTSFAGSDTVTERPFSDEDWGFRYLRQLYCMMLAVMRQRSRDPFKKLLPIDEEKEVAISRTIEHMLAGTHPNPEEALPFQCMYYATVKYVACPYCQSTKCVFHMITGRSCYGTADHQEINYNGEPMWKSWFSSEKRKLLKDKLRLEFASATSVKFDCNNPLVFQHTDNQESIIYNQSNDFFLYMFDICDISLDNIIKFNGNKRKLFFKHKREQEFNVARLNCLPFTYTVVPFAVSDAELNSIKNLANRLYVEYLYLMSTDEAHYESNQYEFLCYRKTLSEEDFCFSPFCRFPAELSNLIAEMLIDIVYSNKTISVKSSRDFWAHFEISEIIKESKSSWEVVCKLGVRMEKLRTEERSPMALFPQRLAAMRTRIAPRVEEDLCRLKESLLLRCYNATPGRITDIRNYLFDPILARKKNMIDLMVDSEVDYIRLNFRNELNIHEVKKLLAEWTPELTMERIRRLS